MAGQEILAFSPLFGRGLLVIGETQLLAAHYPVLANEHTAILAQSGLVFQGFPRFGIEYNRLKRALSREYWKYLKGKIQGMYTAQERRFMAEYRYEN